MPLTLVLVPYAAEQLQLWYQRCCTLPPVALIVISHHISVIDSVADSGVCVLPSPTSRTKVPDMYILPSDVSFSVLCKPRGQQNTDMFYRCVFTDTLG